ncbi:hypothetical protein Tco_0140700 [Tanacetum coccineum]
MASMGSSPFWNTGTIRSESGWENLDLLKEVFDLVVLTQVVRLDVSTQVVRSTIVDSGCIDWVVRSGATLGLGLGLQTEFEQQEVGRLRSSVLSKKAFVFLSPTVHD